MKGRAKTPLEASVESKMRLEENKIQGDTVSKLVCGKCGYKWWPRSQKPVTCPRCKCRKWENYVR